MAYNPRDEEKQLRVVIKEVLAEDPLARDPKNLWRFFFAVLKKLDFNFWADFKSMGKLPSPESIIKERRDIMNGEEGKKYRPFEPEEGVEYIKPDKYLKRSVT